MNIENQKQAVKLLKAAKDILTKCEESTTVLEVMCVTAIWDEAECDGYCLLDEIKMLLEEIEIDEDL